MSALSKTSRGLLAELSTSSRCRPAAVRALRRLLELSSDIDCYKVNAFRFAAENGLSRQESLRLFLYATRLGIFDMHYDIHCPSCKWTLSGILPRTADTEGGRIIRANSNGAASSL